MPMRLPHSDPRARRRMRASLAGCLMAVAMLAQPAYAGLFDDDEARRQVKDLSIQTNERVEVLSKAQIELANQIQALREENAALRGARVKAARLALCRGRRQKKKSLLRRAPVRLRAANGQERSLVAILWPSRVNMKPR